MVSATDDELRQLGLRDARAAERPIAYLREVVARREYIWYTAQSDLQSRQMNTVLGNLWHLINPTLQIAIYYLVFGVVLGTDRGVDNFLTFLAVGVFMFGFTQSATMAGARSIVTNRNLISSIAFPRALLPVTSTLTEILAALPMLFVTIAVALITGEQPSLRWLALPGLFALHCMFATGAALVAARATNHLRDIQQILPFVFRLLFYSSGVIFNVQEWITDHRFRWLFDLNPMYGFITMARWCFFGGTVDTEVLIAVPAWTVVLLIGGFIWFRRGEETYGTT